MMPEIKNINKEKFKLNKEATFMLVRRDSENKVDMVMKQDFDSTGYSFLKYNTASSLHMEEWVETDRLEHYQKLEEDNKNSTKR